MSVIARISITVLACAVMAAWTAQAQQPERQGGPGHRPPKPPIDTALDANGDEVIDAEEISNARAALATLDSDGDGRLTADECLPPRPDHGGRSGSQRGSDQERPDHPDPPVFTALDTNGDRVIDADEISTSAAALRTLDANGDGKLAREESRPPRRHGHGAGASGAQPRS